MKLDFSQGTTRRGIVRLVVCLAAAWAWFTGNTDQAIGAFTVGQALTGYLGIVDEK